MTTYVVAIASVFNGTNTIYTVKANTPIQAKLAALKLAGWDVSKGEKALNEIEDLVSDAVEVKAV